LIEEAIAVKILVIAPEKRIIAKGQKRTGETYPWIVTRPVIAMVMIVIPMRTPITTMPVTYFRRGAVSAGNTITVRARCNAGTLGVTVVSS
jgi:hypothetical protein